MCMSNSAIPWHPSATKFVWVWEQWLDIHIVLYCSVGATVIRVQENVQDAAHIPNRGQAVFRFVVLDLPFRRHFLSPLVEFYLHVK